MARNPVIQIPTTPELYKKLDKYRASSGSVSMSVSCRELLEFALLLKDKSAVNDARTNRELMEEILLLQHTNIELNKQVYMQVWDEDKKISTSLVGKMKENIAIVTGKALAKFEAFMSKEDE